MNHKFNTHVYLDLNYGGAKAGRVVIELFKDKVPKAAENFRALCTGEKGIGKKGKPLHYKGTKFNKVISMCMVQGGDVVNNDGSSGESIYGDTFEDEDFTTKHEEAGMVGMMNYGPNSNQSQFYITTQPCFHLDDTNVVIGRVVKGFNLIVEMSEYPRENDRPLELLIIENCGVYKPGEPWNVGENDETEDVYTPWPDDCEKKFLENSNITQHTIDTIKNSGKHFYNKNDFLNAERKYVKCLRYIDWSRNHKIGIAKDKELRNILVLNLAAVKLRRRKFKEAVSLCTEVLEADGCHVKALYRRAQARLALMDYDKALDDINTAAVLLPHDKYIQGVQREAKKVKLSYLRNERKFYGRVFS